jgi:phosphoglycerate dehydrogenase-like enzyme
MPQKYAYLLDGAAEVVSPPSPPGDDPFSTLAGCHAAIASQGVYNGALMDRFPDLRVISRTGIGYEKIAVPQATARGIVLCYAPDAPTIATAEMAITLMLAAARNLKAAERDLRERPPDESPDFFSRYQGKELYGACLGLIGLGRIGSRVASMAQGIGMSVIAYDPFVDRAKAAEQHVALMSSMDAVLRAADVVSLHVPSTPETRGIINSEQLGLMKDGAILINTARGDLVDQAALVEVLETGRLHGVGLDVTNPEPLPPDHPLLHRDDVIVTPHVASGTTVGKDRLYETAIRQALQVLRGERPPYLVNPEVWDKRKPPGDPATTAP